jgi:hypothetical protein
LGLLGVAILDGLLVAIFYLDSDAIVRESDRDREVEKMNKERLENKI